MDDKYKSTKAFYDNIFDKKLKGKIGQPVKVAELEAAIIWLCKGIRAIFDFGCGSGLFDLRCLDEDDVEYIKGIDISDNAVSFANKAAKLNYMDGRAEFVRGGIDALYNLDSSAFDGCILFNILDSLTKEDIIKVIGQIHRIIRPGGKILVKLNPYIDRKTIEENNLKNIDKNLYKDEDGLYLLNLTDDEIIEMLRLYFNIEKHEELTFKDYNITNRIFYLYKKD